jgi:hypothetical protein
VLLGVFKGFRDLIGTMYPFEANAYHFHLWQLSGHENWRMAAMRYTASGGIECESTKTATFSPRKRTARSGLLGEDLDSCSNFIEQVLRRQMVIASIESRACARPRPIGVLPFPPSKGLTRQAFESAFSTPFHASSDMPQIMMAMRHHAAQKVQRLYKNIKLYKFSQN